MSKGRNYSCIVILISTFPAINLNKVEKKLQIVEMMVPGFEFKGIAEVFESTH